jgi:hypothetical protein
MTEIHFPLTFRCPATLNAVGIGGLQLVDHCVLETREANNRLRYGHIDLRKAVKNDSGRNKLF